MKRYYPDDTDRGMFECEDGPYVMYSQANAQLQLKNETIETLQRQLAEANRKLEETLAAGEKLLAGFNQVTRERDQARALITDLDAIRNELPKEARYAIEAYTKEMPK